MDFGSFFIGGRPVEITGRAPMRVPQTGTIVLESDPNGGYRIEQAYVQWFRPAGGGPKVVLQHGGGLCGTIWETTPDGRPGWAQALLGAGFEVYVIDNVERGRAGWCPYPGIWDGAPILRSAEETWTLFRIGPADGFATRRPFEGQLFPVDRFDDVLPFNVPRWPRSTDLAVDCLAALIARIGPCTVIGHSQGGEIVLRAIEREPALVEGAVLVEPSGSVAGAFPAAFGDIPFLFLLGDFLDRHPVFRTLDTLTMRWVDDLRALGSRTELRRLAGNSHLMMMDRNSDDLAASVVDWLRTGRRRP